ncbi:type IV pilus assembly protein PilW [Silvimonas terrae]|uniref:Type IV pilus assembly protein PilW n=1 Tax=Silvimonas terrae TaxID=300266 RepID=A0A840RF65_9NEIS|nr:PilW family protein [Silvimonas terrae]MBB5191975.1 type IV pilus assembly protein PilW [Silvimonas terrae]
MNIVEMMVAIVIWLLASLAIMSSATFFDSNRRGLTGENSVQENAMFALTDIQRNVKNAGAGIAASNNVTCTSMNVTFNGTVLANGTGVAPVIIADGGANNVSDSITVLSATSTLAASPVLTRDTMTSATAAINLKTAKDLSVGDVYLISPGTPATASTGTLCSVGSITALTTNSLGATINHDSTGTGSTWNGGTYTTAQAYAANSTLAKIGGLNWITYQVGSQTLNLVDKIAQTTNSLAENVVLMKAQYGVSATSSSTVTSWVAGSGSWATPLNAGQISQIRAIRIAMVVRIPAQIKPSVAGGTCDATTASPTVWGGTQTMDISGLTNWKCYKYRTLNMTIPLKNFIFSGTST